MRCIAIVLCSLLLLKSDATSLLVRMFVFQTLFSFVFRLYLDPRISVWTRLTYNISDHTTICFSNKKPVAVTLRFYSSDPDFAIELCNVQISGVAWLNYIVEHSRVEFY